MSFIGLMIREQGRSIDDEQSQGAYDAALAGVEDGKRVILKCADDPSSPACAAIDAQQCDTVQQAGVAGVPGAEVQVTSVAGGGSNDLNLAYTCVVINPEVDDYIDELNSGHEGVGDSSLVIPLRPTSSDVTNIDVYWFSVDDTATVQLPAGGSLELPQFTDVDWPADQPPVLRAQLFQYRSGQLDQADFDSDDFAHTLYLYPHDVGSTDFDFSLDARQAGTGANPVQVDCDDVIGASGYSCHANLTLPALANRVAYLRLSSFYNDAHIRVVMKNGAGTELAFDNVQTSIDSTGRANDLFRRVETRVEIGTEFPYPRATVDLNGNLCKVATIGSNPTEYDDGGCTP